LAVGTVILGGLAAYTFCILADAEKFHSKKDRYNRRYTYPQVYLVYRRLPLTTRASVKKGKGM
jgi:hypothetical protein